MGAPTRNCWWFTEAWLMDHILTYALLHIIVKRITVIPSVDRILEVADITVERPESDRPYRLRLYDDMLQNFDTVRQAYHNYHPRIASLVNADGFDEPWRLSSVRTMVKTLLGMPAIKRLVSLP